MRQIVSRKAYRALLGMASATAVLAYAGGGQAEEVSDVEEFVLDEIIVTAQKRSQNLQDVAMSITAFSGMEMERAGDVSFEDFAVRVANLSFAATGNGGLRTRSVAIRGIFGGGTTGFYIDDTPMEESMNPVVLDLERVEILRGPQGTLYGARSMGGTVRFITKQPVFNETEIKGAFGTSNTKEGGWNYKAEAVVNVPLFEDKMAARIVAYYQYEEGLFDREHADYTPIPSIPELVLPTPYFEPKENVDDYEVKGLQAALKFQAADWLTLNGRVNYQKGTLDGLPFADVEAGNYTNTRSFDIEEKSVDEWLHASLGFNADVGSGSLVGSFAHWDRDRLDIEDLSELMSWIGFFIPQDIYDLFGVPGATFVTPVPSDNINEGEVKGNVAEIRYVSDFDSPFQMVVGGFYSDTKVKSDMVQISVGLSDAVDGLLGFGGTGADVFGFDDLGYSQIFRGQTKEKALFGEASYELTENLKFTAGLRWFETEISVDGEQGGFSGGTVIPVLAKENGFNPKFGIEYNYSDNDLIYASAAKGFRIGGANSTPLGICESFLIDVGIENPQDATAFDSDSIWSYEVGAKTVLADNRVQLNGALYWIDWSDIQQSATLGCGFDITVNSGSAVSKGFELETSVAVTDGLVVDASIGYTDAEITDSGVSNSPISAPGTPVQHIPEWTFSTSAEYTFDISDDIEGRLRGDYSYTGSSVSFTNRFPSASSDPLELPTEREALNLLNLRATAVMEHWEISFYADNVLNEITSYGDSRSLSVETPNRPRLHQNRPRTVGLDVRFRF